jgi:hypothetical protein
VSTVLYFRPGGPRLNADQSSGTVAGSIPAPAALAEQDDKTLSGRADAGKALRLLYGNYDAGQGSARWTLSQPEIERFEFNPDDFEKGRRDVFVKLVFWGLFKQGGQERYILITGAAPPHYECHACAPIIGGAIFSRSGNVWKLDTDTRFITRMGSYGEVNSDGLLVSIGPDRHGVLFRPGWTGQGYTYQSVVILGETGGEIREIASIPQTDGDNVGTCGEKEEPANQPCFSYQARVDFVPGRNREYHDLRIRTTGTKLNDAGKLQRVNETTRYSFDGQEYK